ncbi:unnamed protein product [Candidula unifasciata]|uniref:Lengsin n=1 Tax=Candidula unifasciata TaxID=100452 RepID=A0A8S3YWN5_9EUPU|nr:unnamed protein product [Candidula unifasciata]
MTAFCCPTVNCYRTTSMFHVAHEANWSVGERSAAFRLKIEGQDNIYIENRIPLGASNPYLRKLPLPEAYESKCMLPTDLETALRTLEADTVLTEAMGSKLVQYFCFVKRKFELEEFAAAGNLSDEELLKMENEYYFHNV